MKHSIKITLVAILAMFTFNTVANAQFGLLKGAANAIASNKKSKQKEKAPSTMTVEQLEDAVAWNNKAVKKAIIDYLSELPYCGAKKERNPELKGCKVAEVYLTSQWQENRKTNTAGDKFRTVYFWVVVEATNGKNYAIKGDAHEKYVWNKGYPDELDTAEPDFRNILEVTDWKRKGE